MTALKILRSSRIALYYIFGVLLTIVLVGLHDYLPKRQFRVLPNPMAWAFSTEDRERGGNSEAAWVGSDNSLWRCTLKPGVAVPECSIGVAFSRDNTDWTTGMDFSPYDAIVVDINYTGPAKLLRIHMRNFDKQISNTNDYNSAKFNKINLRISDLRQPIRIELTEFQLAEWWINQYDIPRKWSQATFDKVTSFGMDFAEPAPLGKHEIKINRIDFVGDYISSDTWYLGILSVWMIIILSTGFWRLLDSRKRTFQDKLRLQEMADYALEMKEQAKDFERQSRIDPLTNVYNRIGLQHIIDSAFEWRRNDDKLSLMIIDLDHFKNINDTFGHTVGDEVLRRASNTILQNTRSVDSVARWGGEEFIVLCPHTVAEDALILADKIRLRLKQLKFVNNPAVTVRATIGVCRVTERESFAEAFSRADDALYVGKNAGRDRCILAET